MIPIKDSIPRVHPSWAVWTLMLVNTLVFLVELGMDSRGLFELFHIYGVVPGRFTDTDWARQVGYPGSGWLSFLSYGFLHGNWLHFLINMWTLWIFADNIEDVMGPLRFTAFYLLCGIVAAATHLALHPQSTQPMVGASGSIAGIMGAYFLLYPHAKVLTLIPIFFLPLFIDVPAVLYLGLWFVSQFFSGVFTIGQGEGGVAFWAHAGGFGAGMLLLPLFRIKSRCYYCYDPDGKRIPYRERGVDRSGEER